MIPRNLIREVSPGVFAVALTQDKVALVDQADLEVIAPHRWYAARDHRTFYAHTATHRADGARTTICMQSILMPDAPRVDHVNGDGLDNRRANLRSATHAENLHNCRKSSRNTSGFKGVTWDKGGRRWLAQIVVNSRNIKIGRFADIDVAARAYDAAARAHFGSFAAVNFPEQGERSA
jgi:hypothetical protein